MCIYYKDRNDLSYVGREHIIPAGIGGINVLPIGTVSDQFNNDISKLEQDFIRNSIIVSPVRQIIGPGSRGRSAEKYETKSKVHVFRDYPENAGYSMGYIQKGKPLLIPHVILNTDSGAIDVAFNNAKGFDHKRAMQQLQDKMENPEALHIREFCDNELPENLILFGIADGVEENYNSFFSKNNKNEWSINESIIRRIGKSIRIFDEQPYVVKNKVVSKQSAKWNDEYFRLFGKMLFNLVTYELGEAFVLLECFDPVRDWITKGGDYEFASILKEKIPGLESLGIGWPEYSHLLLYYHQDNTFFGYCSLYGNAAVQIILTTNASSAVGKKWHGGLICDWQNKREMVLEEFITEQAIKIVRNNQ